MPEPTRAQMLLEQVTTGNKLIRRLQAVKAHPLGPVPVKLSISNKTKIQAFRDDVQQHIDQLTAQREQVAALVEQIPDETAQLVLQLRYGLLGCETKKTQWLDMPELVNYELTTVHRYHRKGLDLLEDMLEKERQIS